MVQGRGAPNWCHLGGSGDGIRGHDAGQSEDLFDEARGHQLTRWSLGDDLAGPHRYQMGGETCCLIEVVQHGHQAASSPVQVHQEFHQLHLVTDVEEGGGFVEQQYGGVLGERHRDPGPLALPTRQFIDPSGRQGGDVRLVHGTGDQLLVAQGPPAGEALVGEPAPGHQLGDGYAVRDHRALRQDADFSGNLSSGLVVDVAAVEDHPPGSWLQEPGQRLQQRRLAAAVRPHHGGELRIEDRKVQAAGDDAVAVAEPRPVGPQPTGGCHADLLPSRTRR